MRLKVGFQQARFAQDYQNLADIIGRVMGTKKSSGKADAREVRSPEELEAAVRQIFGNG